MFYFFAIMKKNLLLLFALIIGLLSASPSVFGCDFSAPEIVSYQKTGTNTYQLVIKVCAGGGLQGADDGTNYIGILMPNGTTITSFSPSNLDNSSALSTGSGSCTACTGGLSGTITNVGRSLEFSGDNFEDLNASGSKRRTCQDVTINFTAASDLSGQQVYVVGMENAAQNVSNRDILNDINTNYTWTPSPGSSTGNCTAPTNCSYHCTYGLTLDTPTAQTDLYVVGGTSSITTGVGDNPCTAFQVTAATDCGAVKYNIKNFRNATKSSVSTYPASCSYASGASNGSSSTQDDIWIEVIIPASGILDVELYKTDKVGTNVIEDLALAIYEGDPVCSGATGAGTLTLKGCNDDKYARTYPAPNGGTSVASSTGYFMPQLRQTGLTPNAHAYIRIFDPTIAGLGTSDFYMTITDGSEPADNQCSGASTITTSSVPYDFRACRNTILPANIAYQVDKVTPAASPGCSGGTLEHPVWHKFVSDGTQVTFEFSNINCSNTVYNATLTNDGIQAYLLSNAASDCSGLWTNLKCQSSGDWTSGTHTFNSSGVTLTSGTTYYLLVDGFADDECQYDLRIVPACSAAATDPTGTNQTLCSAGGALSAGPATDAGQAGYTVAYLLVNSSNVIVANAASITALSAPANAAGADCASNSDDIYTLYTLEYETAQGIAITNGTTTLTTIADAAGDIIGATPTATACMDLSAAGITVTVKAPISLTSTATNCSWSYNTCPTTGVTVMYDNDNNGSYESSTPPSINTGTTTVRWQASYSAAPACAITGTTDVSCANNFGEFASAVSLQTCTSGTSGFYNTTGTGANIIQPGRDFTGTLGTFFQNSSGLQLDGAEIKTFKNAGANVCEPQVFYVVYPTGSRPATPVFSPLTLKYKAGCPGPSSSFEDGFGPCNSTNDQKWQYSSIASPYPGGPYLDANIDLTAQAPGSYTLEVYYSIPGSNTSTSGCNDIVLIGNPNTPTYTVTYNIIAPAALASNNATVCSNNNAVTLTATPTGSGITYQWSSAATAVGVTNTATAAPSATSTYTVTVSTNGCQSTSTTSVTVNNAPTNASLTPSCSGTTSVLTATATAGSGGTLAYAITGLSGTAGVFNTSVIAGTTYTVTITESPSNCAVTASATASNCTPVCDNITSPGAIQSAQNACGAFDPATLTELTAPTGGTGSLEYQWQISTTSATTGFTDITGATAISYDPPAVSQTTWFRRCVRRAGCTAFTPTAAVEITINPVPSPTIGSVATLNCTTVTSVTPSVTGLAAGPTYTYNWTGTTGGISANGTTASPTIILPGTYTVVVTNTSQGSCTNSASVVVKRRCITITDPCVCIPNTTPQAFSETVTVTGDAASETWTVLTITNQDGSAFTGSGVAVGDVLTDKGDGTYSISFTHLTAAGFAITLQGPGGATDTISEDGICNATTCGCAAKAGTWLD